MRPETHEAMRLLIAEIRSAIPFDTPEATLCGGICRGCSKKLLDYLEGELQQWECRLLNSEQPSLGDLNKLARMSRKVFAVLKANGLVDA